MSRQRSWCCGFIPGFWWWFLTLVGLPLLFLLMTYFRQGVVESDLTNRVSAALSDKNIEWAEVDVKHRGRDVLLRGVPPTDAARTQAATIAQGVYGVNKVNFEMDGPILSSTEAETAIIMPTLNAAVRDGQLTLQGSLPSQQQIDEIAAAAEQRYGVGNISNQLTVGAGVATPQWLSSADDLLDIMPGQNAALSISEQGTNLSAEVNGDDAKAILLSRAQELLGDGVQDNITVRSLREPEVDVALTNGKMTLSGKVASQQQADRLMQAAAARVGADNVANNLEVNAEYAEAAWLDSVVQFVTSGLPVENGRAKIVAGKLELDAEVDSPTKREQLIAQSSAALQGSGLILVNNVNVNPALAANTAGASENATSREAGETAPATNTASVTESQNLQLAAQACQQKLDAAMTDKKILFRVNKASIRRQSYGLLDALTTIMTDCKIALVGKQVLIGGHTDSDGSANYNLNLSQRRAEAVRRYLTDKGVAAELLQAKGFGEAQPVASNRSAAGKAQNRRISFEIQAAE